MKLNRIMGAATAALLLAIAPRHAQAAQIQNFKDVPSSAWYYSAVEYAAREGLFAGTSADTFSPELGMTRGMFVTVLGRQAGIKDEKPQGTSFTDVAPSAYYAPHVEWARENGIVSGTSETTFSPDQQITREQMAVILHRYLGGKGTDPSALTSYRDVESISGYAQDSMAWAVSVGILRGSDGLLDPQGTATRAQVAQVFLNAKEVLENTKPVSKPETPVIELTMEQKGWLTADQEPQEVLRRVLAGTKAKWDPTLTEDNSCVEPCLMLFGRTPEGMYTTEHAVFNALETLSDTGADRFYLAAGLWEGEPSKKLKLYYTIPEKADSPLMAEIRKLVEKEFPHGRFNPDAIKTGHGWRGYERSGEADWIAMIECRCLREWYSPSDSFDYWISEPEPGKFYFYY